jgi:hypothetical protein
MVEQMGWTDFDDEPLEPSDLPISAQQALILMNVLPDKVEGMSGVWLGKEYSGLSDIMTIYQMIDWKETFEMLQVCIEEYSKYYDEQRKQAERKSKSKMR